MESRLALLLNTRKSGTLPPQTQQELVGEYFTADNCLDDGLDNSSDSELGDEVPETDRDSDPTEEEIDEPIVNVAVAVRGGRPNATIWLLIMVFMHCL